MALRVSAYAVVVEERGMLMARLAPSVGAGPLWTMPGGGIDAFEDPADAVVREVQEETGYAVTVDELLGLSSRVVDPARGPTQLTEKTQLLRVVYRAHVVGGGLAHEQDGSTDRAAWVALHRLGTLPRVELVDVALGLAGLLPPPQERA
ncbi:NUDIX hydrolase [Cellulomonas edaphi]|uniref:NUDIX domain-containing protein n=1 Tax=Cellulomonas edaphi TaxID=3053468 RepID=A0ABT7S2S0_9CELL|nr:NUDIX domain-containing protein [Cellulomons edaphi]MDM7829911.1 NUDIX domain-containing protein [Cellulomons edaphi]